MFGVLFEYMSLVYYACVFHVRVLSFVYRCIEDERYEVDEEKVFENQDHHQYPKGGKYTMRILNTYEHF